MTIPPDRRDGRMGNGPEAVARSEAVRVHKAIQLLNDGVNARPEYKAAFASSLLVPAMQSYRDNGPLINIELPGTFYFPVGNDMYGYRWRPGVPKPREEFGSEHLSIQRFEGTTVDDQGRPTGRTLAAINLTTEYQERGERQPLQGEATFYDWSRHPGLAGYPIDDITLFGDDALSVIPYHFGDLLPQAAA